MTVTDGLLGQTTEMKRRALRGTGAGPGVSRTETERLGRTRARRQSVIAASSCRPGSRSRLAGPWPGRLSLGGRITGSRTEKEGALTMIVFDVRSIPGLSNRDRVFRS